MIHEIQNANDYFLFFFKCMSVRFSQEGKKNVTRLSRGRAGCCVLDARPVICTRYLLKSGACADVSDPYTSYIKKSPSIGSKASAMILNVFVSDDAFKRLITRCCRSTANYVRRGRGVRQNLLLDNVAPTPRLPFPRGTNSEPPTLVSFTLQRPPTQESWKLRAPSTKYYWKCCPVSTRIW